MTKKNHDDDIAFIQALAELLNSNSLTELTVKREYGDDDSLNVRISRHPEPVAQISAPSAAPAPIAANLAPAAPAPAPTETSASDPADSPGTLTSPMVGTVYTQAEPGAPVFAAVGAQVNEGDTVLIIEAMKTMNHIPAPRSGTVKRIFISDGAAVEFGEPLMLIE